MIGPIALKMEPDITLDDIIAINAERATCGAETAENPS